MCMSAALIPCPMCGEQIASDAAVCQYCGEAVGAANRTAGGRTREQLRDIAFWQKGILVSVLLNIGCGVAASTVRLPPV